MRCDVTYRTQKIGQDMAAAKTIAMEISRDKKLPYVNGYDHPHIMSGQGNEHTRVLKQNF